MAQRAANVNRRVMMGLPWIDAGRGLLLNGRQPPQHPRDRLLDGAGHPVWVVEDVFDTVLGPAAPDQPVAPRVDDVEHEGTRLVVDFGPRAVTSRTVSICPVGLIRVDPSRDVG